MVDREMAARGSEGKPPVKVPSGLQPWLRRAARIIAEAAESGGDFVAGEAAQPKKTKKVKKKKKAARKASAAPEKAVSQDYAVALHEMAGHDAVHRRALRSLMPKAT